MHLTILKSLKSPKITTSNNILKSIKRFKLSDQLKRWMDHNKTIKNVQCISKVSFMCFCLHFNYIDLFSAVSAIVLCIFANFIKR